MLLFEPPLSPVVVVVELAVPFWKIVVAAAVVVAGEGGDGVGAAVVAKVGKVFGALEATI